MSSMVRLARSTFCREKLQLPPEQLNPPPLISGEDLRGLGIPAGPVYKQLLEQARDAQLSGRFIRPTRR